jgi:hypothetical protein
LTLGCHSGGAIALGHPVDATGAILVTKAVYELARISGRYGLITMCIGGGQGRAPRREHPVARSRTCAIRDGAPRGARAGTLCDN